MDTQVLQIPPIWLEWSSWADWDDLMADARSGGIQIPNRKPGVYEARLKNSPERLTIGKASDLRMRIRQGLVKGKAPHSAGNRIRVNEDTSNIEIRWAETDRPNATEEELHRQYLAQLGKWPNYTEHT